MDFDPNPYIKDINKNYKILRSEEMEGYLTGLTTQASAQYGENNPGFAALLNELGGYYRTVSKYRQAEDTFLKAKGILERTTGENNPDYATTLNNLAGVYRLTGEYPKAEALFLKAIGIYKHSGHGESYAYSSALNNLGLICLERREYGTAAQLLEEANAIAKKVQSHPVIYATGLGNLAGAYLGLGRSAEAERLLKEAIGVYESNNLEGNLHYAASVNGLGLFYFTTGDYPKAEQLLLQALRLRERDFGRNNHEYAKAADNLRILYEKTGDSEGAEKYAQLSKDAYAAVLGTESPSYKAVSAALENIRRMRSTGAGIPTPAKSPTSETSGLVTGMELALVCFAQFCAATLCRKYPDFGPRIAAGLVGEGSECYGFDDLVSRDHDWGPAFCIWLTKADFERIGPELQREYDTLTKNFPGFNAAVQSPYSAERRGVMEIGAFYRKYIGLDRPPASLREWLAIPETHLSVVTNGKVFMDESREFSRFREELKAFYPEDIRLKKLATRCAVMGQAGQYNYPRSIGRNESVAANHALASFIDAAISAVFLLNREYKPFYKWMHRAMKNLPILGQELHGILTDLATESTAGPERKVHLIEDICFRTVRELSRQGLSQCAGNFLADHAHEIQGRIQAPEIRSMHVMAE